jgi:selenocysteine lyase/cysteine desulfurase
MTMISTDWNAIRSRFPVCSRFTYLNAAGGSPMCIDASIEGKRYFDEMVLYGDACWEEWLDRTEKIRAAVAGLMGATREEIAFTPNTSTAMAFVAQMLRNKGAVLTMNDEFPSTTFPWINLGVKVDFVQPEHGGYSLDLLERSLQPEHKVLITSYVQFKSGFRQDLQEIGTFCKAHNLLFIVNATQAFGVFPIDVARNHIDMLVFSGLKWACAGYGAAGLYIRKDLIGEHHLPVAGWRSVAEPETMNNKVLMIKPVISSLEAGCPSFPGIFALGGAISLINRIGLLNCTERVLHLSHLLEKKLSENAYPLMFNFSNKYKSGIVMVRTGNASLLVEMLAKKNILVSARGEGLRISVNIYNNEEDINVFLRELYNCRSLI